MHYVKPSLQETNVMVMPIGKQLYDNHGVCITKKQTQDSLDWTLACRAVAQ